MVLSLTCCRWLHMPQLQRRALPLREDDTHNHALHHRNHNRLAAILYLPIRPVVAESFATSKRITQTSHSNVTITAFLTLHTCLYISIPFSRSENAVRRRSWYTTEHLTIFCGKSSSLVFVGVRSITGRDNYCMEGTFVAHSNNLEGEI